MHLKEHIQSRAWREKWIIWLLLQIPPILCSPKLLEAWGKDPADQNTFTQVTKSIGGQRIGGIWRRSQKILFSLHALDWMWSLRCIQSARISPDCPYLCLLGSYVTNSYVPMGFQMFVGGFGAQKCFKNKRLSKNIIFKPKSLHKTLGFGRCLWAVLNGNFFHIFLQIPY